jgi:hypothetical protein
MDRSPPVAPHRAPRWSARPAPPVLGADAAARPACGLRPRPWFGLGRTLALGLALGLGASACFVGDERDKAPPAGYPGGTCLPDDTCIAATCNLDGNYCYDVEDPCEGFFCGGEERGECFPIQQGAFVVPSCACFPGFQNTQFSLYCCPLDGSDPVCAAAALLGGSADPATLAAVPAQAPADARADALEATGGADELALE